VCLVKPIIYIFETAMFTVVQFIRHQLIIYCIKLYNNYYTDPIQNIINICRRQFYKLGYVGFR